MESIGSIIRNKHIFIFTGDNDATLIFKAKPGSKRWQHLRLPPSADSNALEDDDNYTVIFGSHRNSCLKIEKNLQECYRVSCRHYMPNFIMSDFNLHGQSTYQHMSVSVEQLQGSLAYSEASFLDQTCSKPQLWLNYSFSAKQQLANMQIMRSLTSCSCEGGHPIQHFEE